MKHGKASFDARSKIIQNKRGNIFDAREKLAEIAKKKDARLKIEQLHLKKKLENRAIDQHFRLKKDLRGMIRNNFYENDKDILFKDTRRQVKAQYLPPSYRLERSEQSIHPIRRTKPQYHFDDIRRGVAHSTGLIPLKRTIHNDINAFSSRSLPINMDIDDDTELVSILPKPKNLKIITRNDMVYNAPKNKRIPTEDAQPTPKMPPSILKKQSSSQAQKQVEASTSNEYRIIVSNLEKTVTESDIQELFADIGGLVDSRLVRPGTAEVIYRKLEDAERAVNLYHNRQLDGQPMTCLLVSSNSTPKATLTEKTTLPASSSSNVVPDISTFHKVLFSNR